MVGLGVGGLVTCKNAIKFDHHGGPYSHTATMGPHSRQQIIQQSTYMLCGSCTSLKLKKMYSLLVILLLMHVALTTTMQGQSLPRIVATRCIQHGYHRRHHGPVVVCVDNALLVSVDGVEVGVSRQRHPSRDVLLCDGG